MKRIEVRVSCVMFAVSGLLLVGCESANQPGASQNSALASPYQAGSGVSSSGFNSKPRFYTGPNGTNERAASTQPASQ